MLTHTSLKFTFHCTNYQQVLRCKKITDLCLTQTHLRCEQLTRTVRSAHSLLVSSSTTHSISNLPERSPAQPQEAGLRAAFQRRPGQDWVSPAHRSTYCAMLWMV